MNRFVRVALTGLVAAGCASTSTVDRFEAPETNIAAMSSYAWKGGDFGLPAGAAPGLLEDADQRLRAAIDAELAMKGYTRAADAAAADFLVSYQVTGHRHYVVEENQRVGAPSANQVLTPGAQPMPPASALPREQSVRDGAVLVFVDDPRSGKLIWRGSVQAETRVSSNDAAVRKAVQTARDIVQELPARAR